MLLSCGTASLVCATLEKLEIVTHDAEAHLYLRAICCFDDGLLALELSGERRQARISLPCFTRLARQKWQFHNERRLSCPEKV